MKTYGVSVEKKTTGMGGPGLGKLTFAEVPQGMRDDGMESYPTEDARDGWTPPVASNPGGEAKIAQGGEDEGSGHATGYTRTDKGRQNISNGTQNFT